LNRDPRTRTAAGFGTTAIQKNQEPFMRKAWSQVRTVIDANKQVKTTVFNMNVALRFTQKTFQQLSSNVLIAIARPVLSRIMGSPTTLYQQIKESPTPAALFSGTFRKMSRKYAAKSGSEEKFNFDKLVNDVNDGKVSPAPPKETPAGIFTLKDAADKIAPYKFSETLDWILKNRTLLAIVALLLFILLGVITGLSVVFIPLIAATAVGYYYANKLAANKNTAEEITDPQKQVEAISNIPPRPNFTLKLDRDLVPVVPTTTASNTDSVEAQNYRVALMDMTQRIALKEPPKPVVPLSLSNTHEKTREGINPRKTFPKRLNALIKFPATIKMEAPEEILPVMAYPDMEDPMYKKLTDISDEAFVPNLKFIQNNTISVLFKNQAFIEAYMVGLNHEMGRELLWREYPTDQRGSYFRQFWDVNGIISPSSPDGTITPEEKDAFKDITQIHTWKEASEKLGTHNNRPSETKDDEQLVLTIRGDLLKKYPDTLVFAQKAVPAGPGDEDSDDGKKLLLELTPQQFKEQIKFPIYRAEVQPDIKFFGFDLTGPRAKGTTPATGEDSLGWYFVIMQAPGAPVFGMDSSFNAGDDGLSWDDLSWKSFSTEIPFITKNSAPDFDPIDQVSWGTDAASMAYILFQKPNMVAVHASKMLAT
jgi:hypothetical protein